MSNIPLLFLNDIGTSELLFVMVVVLMLFGAKNIPSIAKTLGRGMREVKQASDDIKRDIAKSATEMRRDMNMSDSIDQIKKPFEDIQKKVLDSGEEKAVAKAEIKENTDLKKDAE